MTTCVRTFSIINFGIFWKYKSGIQEFPFYSITSSLSGRQALWGATITIFIIEICLTKEFYQTIGVNLLIKYSLLLDLFLSIIEIYLSNTTHHELNTNKSINRKLAIFLTAKFNRIMLKEIFAECPFLPLFGNIHSLFPVVSQLNQTGTWLTLARLNLCR